MSIIIIYLIKKVVQVKQKTKIDLAFSDNMRSLMIFSCLLVQKQNKQSTMEILGVIRSSRKNICLKSLYH